MEFRETVGSLKTGAPVDFFQCKDCGHVHTVEDRTAAPGTARAGLSESRTVSESSYQKLGVNSQGKLTPAHYVSGMDRIPTALIVLFGIALPMIAALVMFC